MDSTSSRMDYGVHLPQAALDGPSRSLRHLLEYVETAEQLGFRALSVSDHLLMPCPWLDGPTALAAVLAATGRMEVATTVALPAVRGVLPLAKSLAAIDLLSGGRLIAGVGAGSSARDYAAVGMPFAERWQRLEEAVQALRAVWCADGPPFSGRFYATEGMVLEPYPAQRPVPPIWIGSWGSEAGLRRVARLGDGWFASAYNTTPAAFADARERLAAHVRGREGCGPLPQCRLDDALVRDRRSRARRAHRRGRAESGPGPSGRRATDASPDWAGRRVRREAGSVPGGRSSTALCMARAR